MNLNNISYDELAKTNLDADEAVQNQGSSNTNGQGACVSR